MSIFQAIILGVVQGVGEFLPISSSGHLVLVPYLFGWDYQGLNFDIALHMGTLIAILLFFWHDWIKIIANGISLGGDSETNKTENNLLWIILVGSIPAAIAGYYLESIAEHALRNPLLIASFLAFFGILLWLADYSFSGKGKIKNIGYVNGFLVGIGQALALFPGVSRSGATITAGLFAGLDRQAATRFSFLLSTPAVFGAFILSLKQFNLSIVDLPFLIAIVTSATFGLLSIKFLLQYINKHGFSIFAIYRLILAAIITILYFSR